MSPDRRPGLSPGYEITDPKELKEAVMSLSHKNVIEAGQIIEARIKTLFADDKEQRKELLGHLASLTSRPRGKK